MRVLLFLASVFSRLAGSILPIPSGRLQVSGAIRILMGLLFLTSVMAIGLVVIVALMIQAMP